MLPAPKNRPSAWSLLVLVIVTLLGASWSHVGADEQAAEQTEGVRTDRLGDPLPKQALLSFGTRRFQHSGGGGATQLLLSADETVVATVGQEYLIGWEAATGKQLWKQSYSRPNNISAAYGVCPLALFSQTDQFVSLSDGLREGATPWDPAPMEISLTNNRTGKSEILPNIRCDGVKSFAVSPDEKLIACGSAKRMIVFDRKGTVVYEVANKPETPMGRDGGDRLMFGGDFSYGRFSPDGKLLALVNNEKPKTIQLMKATTGESVRDIAAHDRIVRIDFSPDSKQIVATERDIAARLYRVADGQRVWEFTILPTRSGDADTSDVTFRPDGKQIAVGAPIGPSNTIRLLDATNGIEMAKLTGSSWKPWTLQYTKDSRTLFGSGWDGVVRRWDVQTKQQLLLPEGVRASATCAMSRDGRHIAFVDDADTIHICNVVSGKTQQTFDMPGASWEQVVFSHDGKHLAAGGPNDDKVTVVVWELSTTQKTHQWTWDEGKDEHSGVEALSFSANGQRIAAAVFRQGKAYVWDLPSNKQITEVTHPNVYGLDIDAEGLMLLTAGWDKQIREWDCETGFQTKSRLVKIDHTTEKGNARDDTRTYGLKISNDQSMTATVDMTGSIRLFDRELNPISVIHRAGSFTFGAVQFSRNDLWIGVGTHRGAQVFDVKSGTRLWAANDHEQYIYTVDFGAKDNTFLSGGSDSVCYLWDLSISPTLALNAPVSPETQLTQLVGNDSVAAFYAYQRLLKTPDVAGKLLANHVHEFKQAAGDTADIGKWVTALHARDEEIVAMARSQLSKHTLSAFDHLATKLESGDLSEKKTATLQPMLREMSFQVRHLTALLDALDTAVADETLLTLHNTAKSRWLKQIAVGD